MGVHKMIKVNGNNIEWRKDMTISDVFKIMNYDYALIAITVNNKFISQDDYDFFKIDDGSDIRAIHICHGG